MAFGPAGLVGILQTRAYLDIRPGASADGFVAATPYLFAGVSGALAVASVIGVAALWRRVQAERERTAEIVAHLRNDLSRELVFTAASGRLTPASPGTARFISETLGAGRNSATSQAPGSDAAEPLETGQPADAAPRRARAAPKTAAPTLGQAELHLLVGAKNAALLHPLIGRLLREGEAFHVAGAAAQGGGWLFTGETVGARAVVRLLPLLTPGADDPAKASRSAVGQAAVDTEKDASTGAISLADAAQRAEATDLRMMLDHGPSGLIAFRADRRLVAANPTARRMLDLAEDWIAAEPSLRAFFDRLHQRQRMPEQANFRAWRDTALENPVAALTATPLWMLSNGDVFDVSAEWTPSGGFVLFLTDQTESLALERRFNTAIGARRATIAAVDQGLALVGSDGRVQLLNPSFAEMWRLDIAFGAGCAERFMADGDDALRVSLTDLARAAVTNGVAEDKAIWARIETAALKREPPRRKERFAATRPGAEREQNLSIRITPLPDGASLIACVDVTDAKAAERALRERAEALEAADRLKTDFLTDMAYQLRTPLNAVIGFADMLKQGLAGKLQKQQEDYVGFVLAAANDLRELVSDALDLGALRAGSLALRKAPFDLSAAAATVASMAEKRAEGRQAMLVASISAEPLPVIGDERRLRHALFGAVSALLNDAEAGDEARFLVRRAAAGAQPDGAPNSALGGASMAEITVALARRKPRPRNAESDGPRAAAAARPDPGGVSLTLARRVVEALGGRTEVGETAEGLTARLFLPLDDGALIEGGAQTGDEASGEARKTARGPTG